MDGKWGPGEQVEHSAIVTSVDKDGNAILVRGKMGQGGLSTNHPNAPGYYNKAVTKNGVVNTSRAYFRASAKGKKTQSSSSNSGPGLLTPPSLHQFLKSFYVLPQINKTFSPRPGPPHVIGIRAPAFVNMPVKTDK